MLKDMLNGIKENQHSQKYVIWGFIGFMSLFAVYTFVSSYWYQKHLDETILVMERQIGEFRIVNYQGPAPFKVDIIDTITNEKFNNVIISVDCPKYEKNAIGLVVPMYKILNLKAKTKEKFYTFDGAYDLLCTNKK